LLIDGDGAQYPLGAAPQYGMAAGDFLFTAPFAKNLTSARPNASEEAMLEARGAIYALSSKSFRRV